MEQRKEDCVMNSRKRNTTIAVVFALAIALGVGVATAALTDVFELDSNIVDVNPGPLPDDWTSTNTAGGGNSVAHSNVVPDPAGTTIFTTGGSKDDLEISSWRHSSGSAPPKDEITNAYAASYVDPTNNHLILVFGADRFANNGSSTIGFWFFKNTIN